MASSLSFMFASSASVHTHSHSLTHSHSRTHGCITRAPFPTPARLRLLCPPKALAGLLWSKQFYHYIVKTWLEGDPKQPPPDPQRSIGRNSDWVHLFNRDVIIMPDKVMAMAMVVVVVVVV